MISSGQTLAQSGGFPSTLGSVAGLHAPRAADPVRHLTRLLPTEFAFLRFTAGIIRALLAVLIGTLLLGAARRHTPATEVTVQLDVDPHNAVLRLRNDCTPGEARPRDFVPRSLTERAAEFGGAVSVTHRLKCTEIVITLPLPGVLA